MDYEKKYKEAQKWIEGIYPNLSHEQQMEAEAFFPELKESEDEKTRKRIIALVNAHGQGMYKDDMLAWLKNIPYTIDHEKREGFYLGYKAGLEKQGDHKLAWSEEDKEMCQETIDWFEKKCFPYALESENPARESINWLKSLKQRIAP